MTTKKAIKLAKRVEFWQRELAGFGLGHWRIEGVSFVDVVPGEPGSLAGVAPSESYASVRFWFQNDHVEQSTKREFDETIVHEWVHVAMRDLDSAIESVQEKFNPDAWAMWTDRVTHEREALVDAIARDIVARYYATLA